MQRLTALILAGLLLATTVGACSWAGRTTGKVVNKVEDGAQNFENSYEKERSKE